jgi:hypothetical protein
MTLQHPLEIPPTHAAFKSWWDDAYAEYKRLDEAWGEAQTKYLLNNGPEGETELAVDRFGLKLECQCLLDTMRWTWRLWRELAHEMD